MIFAQPIALQLRFLQTMKEISSEHNTTTIQLMESASLEFGGSSESFLRSQRGPQPTSDSG